jgi:8-oxo-dGTP pyrophosphatase MutT (NUDIX family)
VREAREETGYDITIEHLIGEYGRPGAGQEHALVYRAKVCGGHIPYNPGRKHAPCAGSHSQRCRGG